MKVSKRFWEIDVVRAAALFLMLVQHVAIVWNYVFIGKADSDTKIEDIGHTGAIVFLLLVGLSGYISYHKKNVRVSYGEIVRKFFYRGVSLLGWGFSISIMTFIVFPQTPVYFGVLSFIGLSVATLPFIIRFSWLKWTLLFTAPVMGYLLSFIQTPTYALLPLGIYPRPFSTLDYWPFFPWISVVIIGVILGENLYTKGKRQVTLGDQSRSVGILLWIGSHTLLIYMIHLPLLYIVIKAFQYLITL